MEENKNKTKPVKSVSNKSLKKTPQNEVSTMQPISPLSESEKIDIEKINLEKEKITLERDKLFVTSLIEDFKARWQELLNFENENSRWQTLYVTALILVISWVLSNSGETGRYKKISEIFKEDNSYLLLTLALINAVYTLAMAYKGYQIQEIAQYLYTNIGNKINDKTSIEFNSWERWRRDKTGNPKFIRNVYYFIISILPTAVSGTILGLFYNYRYPVTEPEEWLNAFFIFVSVFVIFTLVTALSTTLMNNQWNKILSGQQDDNSDARN